ncbi:hypothetical protein SAMN05216598_2846 [Pseudomonas asplenii]|uniref:Uncharacterized protein n=2 Tax=Pseudomonas asplenii TaxID=53407 RepID=A0A1H6P5Y3_9PSED|nr:hypothetical protein SAMN05216598_2846 [Pseudomonas asplenii]SEI24867.1 hypothetical protein SAMN05216581_5660 [Pseudomonas fuscovaginae]
MSHITEACDALPQFNRDWSLQMTVKVTERDDAHMSHEGLAAGIRIWDVHQQDLLVGMFHNEADAQQYKSELENLEMKRQPQHS